MLALLAQGAEGQLFVNGVHVALEALEHSELLKDTRRSCSLDSLFSFRFGSHDLFLLRQRPVSLLGLFVVIAMFFCFWRFLSPSFPK